MPLGTQLIKKDWQKLADLLMYARSDDSTVETILQSCPNDTLAQGMAEADREVLQRARMIAVGYMGHAPKKRAKKPSFLAAVLHSKDGKPNHLFVGENICAPCKLCGFGWNDDYHVLPGEAFPPPKNGEKNE